MSEENEELIKAALLGKQVENFLSSDVGRYLKNRITEERAQAISQFAACNPTDQSAIIRIQNQLLRADSMISWISGAITDGLTALNILESGEN